MTQSGLHEVVPGIHGWSSYYEPIGSTVNSYYLEDARIIIDPLVGDGGLEMFGELPEPRQIVLTSGHHLRDAPRFAQEFDCRIRASREAAEHIAGNGHPDVDIDVFLPGEELAPNVTPIVLGVLAPDEGALHIDFSGGALALADAVTRDDDGELAFFPDSLLGDDPEAVKKGLRDKLNLLLSRRFDTLLLAHADPIVGGAHDAVERFATAA